MVSPAGTSFHGVEIQTAKTHGVLYRGLCGVEHHLIIEIDGDQHAGQTEYDQHRDAWLRSQGYTVLRFWNHEIMQQLEGE